MLRRIEPAEAFATIRPGRDGRVTARILRRGSRRTLHVDAKELVYERVLGEERIVVSLNLETLAGKVSDPSGRDRLVEDQELGVSPDQGPR